MAQLLVRNLEESVKDGLRRRARRHGRGMEAEVRDILRAAAALEDAPSTPLGTRIAARFSGIGLTGDLPELRGHEPRPADLVS